MESNMKDGILYWLLTGETGISSKCIASVMCDIEPREAHTPCDPDDFKRCLLLIRAIPGIKDNLDKMRPISEKWNMVIDHWKEIEGLFMAEVPQWLEGDPFGRASKTYEAMKALGL